MSAIDDVKERLDIVGVISEYVALQKAGHNFKALCPFHAEKTPSFFVYPDRQSWHCFGSCGTGGDVFAFVMKKEGLDFGGALKLLAEKAGVALAPKRIASDNSKGEKLHQINEAAARYYRHLLLNAPQAQGAREYLEMRGVSAKSAEDFQLGFSPDSWDMLQRHLLGQGYGEAELLAAGLVVEREGGGTYDRFRQRLMFPINDPQGRVVGFGARALDGSVPKYINSPQTAVFDKGGMLYGVDRAQGAIRGRGQAVIVEGYMDVIIAHQYGMNNVVASMGTALSARQVDILKRFTTNLVLALDADAAGAEATLRDLEVVLRASDRVATPMPDWLGASSKLSARIGTIVLPQGKDPDEVIKESPEAWQRLVAEALPMMDYLFEAAKVKFDLSQAVGRRTVAEELLPRVAEMEDAIEQELYLQKLSRLVGVDERTLAQQAARLRSGSTTGKRKAKEEIPLPSMRATFGDPLEEDCLALLLQQPELRERCAGLSPDDFQQAENREVFAAWLGAADLESLCQALDDSLQEHLDTLLAKVFPSANQEQRERALADYLRRLRERRLRALKAHEGNLVSEGGASDSEQVAELERQGLEVNTQLKEIFTDAKRGKGLLERR